MSNPLPPGATGTDHTFAPALLGTFREGVSVLEQGIQQIKNAWNGLINAVNGFIQRVTTIWMIGISGRSRSIGSSTISRRAVRSSKR